MKVIGFSGSPNKDGNTSTLVKKALEGAAKKGAEASYFNLSQMDIKGCRSCMHCRKEGKCAIKDDMQKLYKEIEKADSIILGTPVYMYKETAQTKAFIDRLFPFLNIPEHTSKISKTGAMIITQGNPDPDAFKEGFKTTADALTLLGIDIKDTYIQGSISQELEIKNSSEALNKAKALGESLT